MIRALPAWARTLLAVAVPALVGVTWWLTRPPAGPEAIAAVERFFSSYVTEDGRVVRPEGDTVSEGQAYALLMAVAAHKPHRFASVWRWTDQHLVRADGGMAWLWNDGAVVDDGMAPDADIDAAVALFLAADRFGRPDYAAAARRGAAAVLESSTARVDGRLILTAGEWASGAGSAVVNPSYLDPAAFRFMRRRTGDGRWTELSRSATWLLSQLVEEGLPPDWAVVDGGAVEPIRSPDEPDQPGRYGLDAARVPIRLAWGCDDGPTGSLSRRWPVLRTDPGAGVRQLTGQPDVEWDHPTSMVAAAAVADSAAPHRVDDLLDRAAAADRRHPSYYGAAWVALGRLILTSSSLERCG